MQYAEQLSKRTDTEKRLQRKGIYEEKTLFQLHIGTAHHRELWQGAGIACLWWLICTVPGMLGKRIKEERIAGERGGGGFPFANSQANRNHPLNCQCVRIH